MSYQKLDALVFGVQWEKMVFVDWRLGLGVLDHFRLETVSLINSVYE
jgi:hypothetical protein